MKSALGVALLLAACQDNIATPFPEGLEPFEDNLVAPEPDGPFVETLRTATSSEDFIRVYARGFVLAGPDLLDEGRPPSGWPLDRPPYHLETSRPGVFVAGDARAESAKRVASAVGEGAMAVMLVHRYLEQL